ncbi:MAG: metallophosphoesterase [Polaromonas sp.]|jgi:exonuclease SbcD|nr:metallophosphoesterase [Polaromonas sp.]
MTRALKFIHAADLHIDSPMRGLNSYDGAPVDALRGATRRALVGLVELALREQVALVVLAGDIFDRDLGDFSAALFFREQMARLTRTGVRVFVVKGNHDAEGQISKRVPELPGLHVFSAHHAEVIDLPELGVAVHGKSFPERVVDTDLVPSYPKAVAGRFNIGVLHTSLTGRPPHNPYAPTTAEALATKNYDYFALGHVHQREVVREAMPRIVFSGNLQGRHVGETGSKGCELVTVQAGAITSAEHVPLDVVRWHHMQVDATGLASVNALAASFQLACRRAIDTADDRLHAMRVTVGGESVLAGVEAAEPGSMAAAIQAATQDLGGILLWVESVKTALRLPLDRQAAGERPDAVGEVIRLVDELMADDAALAAWAGDNLDKLPGWPAGMDTPDNRLDAHELRACLADAEATVLSRLSGS